MRQIIANLMPAAAIGTVLVLPLMILEWANRRQFHEGYPTPLFVLLWLLPAAFILILRPVVRDARAGSVTAVPLGPVLRVACLVFIAWLWAFIVVDQMPCFLGVPNCD